jgi:hypothetical protein
MREERDEELLVEARKYVETEQEGGGVFYLNVETGEAETSPPPSGYTKKDGLLVLSTGKVIEDPFTNMTPEEKKAKLLEKKCSECEDRNATRKCDQCGDKYCASCYDDTHTTGARVHHVWQRLGHIECVECEGVPKVHAYLLVLFKLLLLFKLEACFDVVSVKLVVVIFANPPSSLPPPVNRLLFDGVLYVMTLSVPCIGRTYIEEVLEPCIRSVA